MGKGSQQVAGSSTVLTPEGSPGPFSTLLLLLWLLLWVLQPLLYCSKDPDPRGYRGRHSWPYCGTAEGFIQTILSQGMKQPVEGLKNIIQKLFSDEVINPSASFLNSQIWHVLQPGKNE